LSPHDRRETVSWLATDLSLKSEKPIFSEQFVYVNDLYQTGVVSISIRNKWRRVAFPKKFHTKNVKSA